MSNFTEEFATEYARNAVPAMLKAISSIKRYNKFVLLGALATSYLHQAHYLWIQGAQYFAYIVPLIFDAAMVSMLTVVRTPGIARDAKKLALVVFAGTALLSATVNFASPGTLSLRLIFALVVVLVIGVELVAGRIRPDFAAIEAQAAELMAAADNIKAASATATIKAESTPDDTPEPAATQDGPPVHTSRANVPPAPVEPPAHLIGPARFASVSHQQATGHPITADELAARLNIDTATAQALLDRLDGPTAINGSAVGGLR